MQLRGCHSVHTIYQDSCLPLAEILDGDLSTAKGPLAPGILAGIRRANHTIIISHHPQPLNRLAIPGTRDAVDLTCQLP